MHVKDPVVHVRVQWIIYENTNISSMHLYPRRCSVAAQVAEELKMAAYATPPMEEHRKKERKDVYISIAPCLWLKMLHKLQRWYVIYIYVQQTKN